MSWNGKSVPPPHTPPVAQLSWLSDWLTNRNTISPSVYIHVEKRSELPKSNHFKEANETLSISVCLSGTRRIHKYAEIKEKKKDPSCIKSCIIHFVIKCLFWIASRNPWIMKPWISGKNHALTRAKFPCIPKSRREKGVERRWKKEGLGTETGSKWSWGVWICGRREDGISTILSSNHKHSSTTSFPIPFPIPFPAMRGDFTRPNPSNPIPSRM